MLHDESFNHREQTKGTCFMLQSRMLKPNVVVHERKLQDSFDPTTKDTENRAFCSPLTPKHAAHMSFHLTDSRPLVCYMFYHSELENQSFHQVKFKPVQSIRDYNIK